ncbi:MAG: hypothetical protein JXR41_12680 [Bacteroidales bacterium]|nr:hypothetical protein [Bacteroidales bacterium]
MRTKTLNLILIAAMPILSIGSSQGQSSGKSFNGKWSGTINNGTFKVILQRSDLLGGNAMSGVLLRMEELKPVTGSETGEYKITRDAGTLILKGEVGQKEGSGTFSLVTNQTFLNSINESVVAINTEDAGPQLFYADINTKYLALLQSNGYTIQSEGQLMSLAANRVDYTYLAELLAGLESHGYGRPSLDKLIQMKVHGVDADYLAFLNKMGSGNVSADKALELKDQGITNDYVQEYKKIGFRSVTPEKALDMKRHNVTVAYITEMQKKGYTDLTLDEYKALKTRNVGDNLQLEVKVDIKSN